MQTYWNIQGELQQQDNYDSKCWLEVTCPTEEETKYLVEEMEVPEYFVQDIQDIDERARIEHEDGWTLIIVRIPYMKSATSRSPFMTVPLGVAFRKDTFVTICYHDTHMMSDFTHHHKRKNHRFIDAVDLVFHLFLSSCVWYLKKLKVIKLRIDKAKREFEGKDIDNKDLVALSRLQDSLIFFATSLQGNESLLTKLKFKLPIDALDAELIEDVTIELNQARISADIYSNILETTLDIYASIISNNMNSVMKMLTSFSIIMMFPTLIASIYGMNLINGMEQWTWGMPATLLLSVGITVTFWVYFKKKNWI